MDTPVSVNVLVATLRRDGVWLVDLHGVATTFYHRACFDFKSVVKGKKH